MDLPNPQERLEILKTLTRKTPLDPTVSLQIIAYDPRTEGLSGADLAAVVREAAVSALRSHMKTSNHSMLLSESITVSMSHFDTAILKITPSVSKKDKKRYELLRVKFNGEQKEQA